MQILQNKKHCNKNYLKPSEVIETMHQLSQHECFYHKEGRIAHHGCCEEGKCQSKRSNFANFNLLREETFPAGNINNHNLSMPSPIARQISPAIPSKEKHAKERHMSTGNAKHRKMCKLVCLSSVGAKCNVFRRNSARPTNAQTR